MNKIWDIFKEQWIHRHLIWKLTIYNIKSQYANHYLGVFWNILQPAMQVLIYYVVFGLGLRGDRGDVGEIPFIIYLISGIFPWLFISQGINQASNAIQAQIGLVTKMKFPSSILLSMALTNSVINLCMTTALLLILSLVNGYSAPLDYLGFFYFVFASYMLIFGIALIMSSLVILVRDMKNVLQNVIRMFFFMTPIFWSLEEANGILQVLSSLNPFAYLLMNYRNAMVLDAAPFYGNLNDHLYFWSLALLLIYTGAHIHYRFRNKLVDYL
ncbi:ABC transporter permease [Salinicoccus roseus]|uniref:ABC transporter permease n=1 Tax=Salinicoccus roseus TaxID=45670 RepID=UPI000F50D95D|nr:ABC transporter permease [Salinicoccus roseus]RPE54819.1 teichoic acid transport system permease protein [Salinicoccus roseus]GGA62387.1 teichoic acid translocation permease protein TagG [Salinicoccus roseus]